MRLRQSVREHLEAWAKRGRRSESEIAQELIEERMRTRECPGIYFATEPSGRTSKIAGTIRRGFGQLSSARVTAALMYGRRYRDEIRGEIEANAALTPEVLEQRYPGLVRVVRGG